jgi:beta-N-acetylhexosaminidase
MKKKRKKGISPAMTIMLCAIVLLTAVLCIMQYAKYQKKVADAEQKASLTENDGDNSGTQQNVDDAEQNTEKDTDTNTNTDANADANTDTDAAADGAPESDAAENEENTGESRNVPQTELERRVEEKLDEMTLEEKVAQMFIVTPDALTGVDGVTAAGETTRLALEQYPVGGLVYFEKNLNTSEKVQNMLSMTQEYSMNRIGVQTFLAVDEEGGTVRRISGKGDFQAELIGNMADIGATGEPNQAYETGKTIGTYLGALGFNLNFAPDADVLNSEDNAIWAKRSFGMDPEMVGQMVAAEVRGLQETGVLATLKHFPGHGSAETDSHKGMAVVDKSKEELLADDWVPFRAGIDAEAGMVMVGHISVPKVIGDNTPSSLSYRMVTEILRNELGYDGLVVTDALNMGAVTEQYSSSQAAAKAVMAGVDLILMPVDFQEAYQGVLDAVERESITPERIDASVRRILRVKMAWNA